MSRSKAASANKPSKGTFPSSPAIQAFLDGLAELIADSILEARAEGTPVDFENASGAPVATEEDP